MRGGADHLSIGTLSFSRCDGDMELQPRERLRLILAAVQAYEPDLLVTGGDAVHTKPFLRDLAEELRDLDRSTFIVTEVLHDLARPSARKTNAMYAISPGGSIHAFGRQQFGTSRELESSGSQHLGKLEAQLSRRIASLGDWNVFALNCGELNVIKGRENPTYRSRAVEQAIMAADVVINPTHDRMSNAGTLHAKRQLLSLASMDGRNRVYVSCSNWESCGSEKQRVQYPSPTLHTVYAAGARVEADAKPAPSDGAFGFQYRHWSLAL